MAMILDVRAGAREMGGLEGWARSHALFVNSIGLRHGDALSGINSHCRLWIWHRESSVGDYCATSAALFRLREAGCNSGICWAKKRSCMPVPI